MVDGQSIKAFLDDANPFSVEEVPTMVMKTDVNGKVFLDQRPAFAKIRVTVITGTEDNAFLREVYENSLKVGDDVLSVVITAQTPKGYKYKFGDAYCVGSTPCFSVSPNGKIGGMTYVFQALLNDVEISK